MLDRHLNVFSMKTARLTRKAEPVAFAIGTRSVVI